jgi:hypothetical protein
MSRARAAWDFGYAPVTPAAGAPEPAREIVVATGEAVNPARIAEALEGRAETLVSRAPIFWTRVVLAEPALPEDVARRLFQNEIAHRYVASAERPSLAIGARLGDGSPARPEGWKARAAGPSALSGEPSGEGAWFLREGEGGVAVDRARCGRGAGTRLAVIDDDALGADALDLDAEVLVGLDAAPRNAGHGALMVAWASGARGFAGVAPEASPRLYLVPKPGRSVVFLPLAIVRAVLDGADVIVCATYVEGSTSPMLDDALELATRFGRGGKGAAVVFPTGREASSPPGSLHASFSLGLGEPASDPRVFCVGPGARGEGWFLWRDRKGRLRPFANRGPRVRWLAPGDDVAYPFASDGRLFHAESSGASAIAAGVLLLVLAQNHALRRGELAAAVDRTLTSVPPDVPASLPLADPADVLPRAADRDGHNAKHGYGRLHAARACLAASDPVCAALTAIGEDAAAVAYFDARRGEAARAYSRRAARWAARAVLRDGDVAHDLSAIVRHLRLVAGDEMRREAHGSGAIVRALRVFLRRLAGVRPGAPPRVRAELSGLDAYLGALPDAASFERALADLAARMFDHSGAQAPVASSDQPG